MPILKIVNTVSFKDVSDLEHHIKEHSPFAFEDKITLLKERKLELTELGGDADETITVTIEGDK